MENIQIDNRHNELAFWSSIDDMLHKGINVKQFRGFRFNSIQETSLWEIQEFKSTSLPFYVFLGELSKAHSYISVKKTILHNNTKAKERLVFAIRLAILASVLSSSASKALAALDAVFSENPHPGYSHLTQFLIIGKKVASQLYRELYFSDPNYFIVDIFGGIRQAQSSSAYTKVMEMFKPLVDSMEQLMESGFLNLFFDFTKELKNKLSTGDDEDSSTNDKQIIMFEDGIAWIDNDLDNSIYSLVFSNISNDNELTQFLEVFRIYMKQKVFTISSMRSFFIKQIVKKMIETKLDVFEMFSLSSGVLGGYNDDEVYALLAKSYNLSIVTENKDLISETVREELMNYNNKLSCNDIEDIQKAHAMIFANVVEKISNIFLENQPTSMLQFDSEELMSEHFVILLGDIMKETYVDFVTKNNMTIYDHLSNSSQSTDSTNDKYPGYNEIEDYEEMGDYEDDNEF